MRENGLTTTDNARNLPEKVAELFTNLLYYISQIASNLDTKLASGTLHILLLSLRTF
jgi:hypothetical protein